MVPEAELATAKSLLAGNIKERTASPSGRQMQLRRGSPEWLRAEDIIEYHQRSYRTEQVRRTATRRQ